MGRPTGSPIFFETPAQLRRWFESHHGTVAELLVGFRKKASGLPTVTWSEAVDEALCFGWIDGIRRSVDAGSYTIRFTPRRRGSTWSAVNIRKAEELTRQGRMHPTGLKAFQERDPRRAGLYSFEQREAIRLDEELEARFRADAAAWAFWQAQPPGYRKTATFYVMSAKRPETRLRRLQQLIEDSAQGRRLAQVIPRRADPPRA